MFWFIRLVFAAVVLASLTVTAAHAQSGDDQLDIGNGSRTLGGSETDPLFPEEGLNDGVLGFEQRPVVFADANGPAGTVDRGFIGVFPGSPQVVRGVELFAVADGGVEDGPRGTSLFRLFGDTVGVGQFDLLLVDGVNPRDDGSPNRYLFDPVALFGVRAEFTRSTDLGPRIIELDGIRVPEPGSAGALALVAAAALLRRRRRVPHRTRQGARSIW
jgi:hypothetical protein